MMSWGNIMLCHISGVCQVAAMNTKSLANPDSQVTSHCWDLRGACVLQCDKASEWESFVRVRVILRQTDTLGYYALQPFSLVSSEIWIQHSRTYVASSPSLAESQPTIGPTKPLFALSSCPRFFILSLTHVTLPIIWITSSTFNFFFNYVYRYIIITISIFNQLVSIILV